MRQRGDLMEIEDWLERKFLGPDEMLKVTDGYTIEGYASLYGLRDRGGDIVMAGAYTKCLARLAARGEKIRMLWQHDPSQPIGVWDEIKEDAKGLWVRGHLLSEVEKGREAAALLSAGAIDGLSIGYRTVQAERDGKGQRLLSELDLWEVSLVTFPMLREARVAAKAERAIWRDLAELFEQARLQLAER